jgi:hypothetical protein
LERRAAADLGAASVDIIFAGMQAGGYLFDAKNDGTARRSLSISLAKNTSTFHRLPNGDFGLLEWYPNIPTRTRTNGKDQQVDDEEKAATDLDQPYPRDFGIVDPDANVLKEALAGMTGAADTEQTTRKAKKEKSV